MKIVETTAPISIEHLKEYFADKTVEYLVDYTNSSIKGKKLLIYLSNLELPIDIKWENTPEHLDLLKDYLHFDMIVDIPSLEIRCIEMLLQRSGVAVMEDNDKDFVETNADILDKWIQKINSLTLYNMYTVNLEEFKDFVESFPQDDTDEIEGINFVKLVRYPETAMLYDMLEEDKLRFYTKYFTEPMFKGNSLYHYWAVDTNPMFLLTYGIAEGLLNKEQFEEAVKADIEEIQNVSSV